MGHDGPPQCQGLCAQSGAAEATGADEQRAGGVHVGVGGRLRVLDAAVPPQI